MRHRKVYNRAVTKYVIFFHRCSHFCTQTSDRWFQKRDKLRVHNSTKMVSLILKKKPADPHPMAWNPWFWSCDPRFHPSDPWSHPLDLWSHIPRYNPVIWKLKNGCAQHFSSDDYVIGWWCQVLSLTLSTSAYCYIVHLIMFNLSKGS